jgi:serine/threonine protein kinase
MGIVHRDIKADNFVIQKYNPKYNNFVVQIADFSEGRLFLKTSKND